MTYQRKMMFFILHFRQPLTTPITKNKSLILGITNPTFNYMKLCRRPACHPYIGTMERIHCTTNCFPSLLALSHNCRRMNRRRWAWNQLQPRQQQPRQARDQQQEQYPCRIRNFCWRFFQADSEEGELVCASNSWPLISSDIL
jgi:hypothetical protein